MLRSPPPGCELLKGQELYHMGVYLHSRYSISPDLSESKEEVDPFRKVKSKGQENWERELKLCLMVCPSTYCVKYFGTLCSLRTELPLEACFLTDIFNTMRQGAGPSLLSLFEVSDLAGETQKTDVMIILTLNSGPLSPSGSLMLTGSSTFLLLTH